MIIPSAHEGLCRDGVWYNDHVEGPPFPAVPAPADPLIPGAPIPSVPDRREPMESPNAMGGLAVAGPIIVTMVVRDPVGTDGVLTASGWVEGEYFELELTGDGVADFVEVPAGTEIMFTAGPDAFLKWTGGLQGENPVEKLACYHSITVEGHFFMA